MLPDKFFIGIGDRMKRKPFSFTRCAALSCIALLAWPFLASAAGAAAETPRPNILWIVSEDNGPYLGCYGDDLAATPNLDRMASVGVRYANAFANAPVCSAARSTLITGMYATTLGIHNHRSKVKVPPTFRLYPEYLRDAGYYCTNNSKTDYNIVRNGRKAWDESSGKAHYKNRKPGQPFFAVFNIGVSHEGQLTEEAVGRRREQGLLPQTPRIAPEDVRLPPYHADTPVVRRDWSIYYDNMTLMDREVGRLLDELEQQGLAEDTIVFYYADHGGALPRGKRNIHDSGTRVPLILRFPDKWAHLAPAKQGEWLDRPVGFVDFPATVFSLTGVPIPKHFQGQAFLGAQAAPPRDHVFLFRGRMDERYDTVRAIRDARYRYVRNYSPHRPWGQHYFYPFKVMPSMGAWHDAFKNGECNPVQARYWQPKPSEELYDTRNDPHEINNLAEDPQFAARLDRMRKALRNEIVTTRDAGLIPEAMYEKLTAEGTVYDYAQSDAYPADRIARLAEHATSRDPEALEMLIAACEDPHPVVRYWAATGCLVLQENSKPAKEQLKAMIKDDWPIIRVVAAEALSFLGEEALAFQTLEAIAKSDRQYDALAALNALEFMYQEGNVTLAKIKKLAGETSAEGNPGRISGHFQSLE